jgi:hypothetical protein
MAEPSSTYFYFVNAHAGDCDVGAHMDIGKWFSDKAVAVKAYKKALKKVQNEVDWQSHLVESEPSLEWNGAHFYDASILAIPGAPSNKSQPSSEEIGNFIEGVLADEIEPETAIILPEAKKKLKKKFLKRFAMKVTRCTILLTTEPTAFISQKFWSVSFCSDR